tara:strand:+ start:831 stop:1475 length:645 start_codon:yes stop_codon:yes gene_type:complete
MGMVVPFPKYDNFLIKEGKLEIPLCTEYTMEDMSYLDTPQAKPIFEKQADIIIEKQSKGIIDIGCRHGPVNTILHEKGYTEYLYMGFDTSLEPIEIAKNQWYNFPNVEYRHTNWNNIKDITVDFNVDQVIWSGVLIYNPNNHKELFDKLTIELYNSTNAIIQEPFHEQIHWDDKLILRTITEDLSEYKKYKKYKEYIIDCEIFAGKRIIIDITI